MLDQKTFSMRKLVQNMGSSEILKLGVDQLAYVRMIEQDHQSFYAVHAADGTPLSMMESYDEAVQTIEDNDLKAVTVH